MLKKLSDNLYMRLGMRRKEQTEIKQAQDTHSRGLKLNAVEETSPESLQTVFDAPNFGPKRHVHDCCESYFKV